MDAPPSLDDLLSGAPPRRRWPAYAAAAAGVIAVVLGTLVLLRSEGNIVPRYRTVEAVRGDLTVRVSATGEIEPVNQVDVGTEISGTVETVRVDFNDRVRVGDVLAELDTDQLEAHHRMSLAALALAEARVREAQATLAETRNRLRRADDLIKRGMSSQEEADAAEAAFARSEAAAAVADAQVAQARAQLDADARTLAKAVIRSPIDGIVLKRQVEPGQTVAASLGSCSGVTVSASESTAARSIMFSTSRTLPGHA
jgi:HlyD family secretion protein